MENAPVITLSHSRVPPPEEERFRKWVREVYYPLYIQHTGVTGIDNYSILNVKAGYPPSMAIQHYPSLSSWQEWLNNPVTRDVFKDRDVTFHREIVWSPVFQLKKSFVTSSPGSKESLTTIIENAPIISILGFKSTDEKAEEFEAWLKGEAFRTYIPVVMKLDGLKAVNVYEFTGLSVQKEAKEPNYPQSIAIIYFDNLEAYETFERSAELYIFRKAIKYEFPEGVSFRFNVQYQLLKSYRK
jgi:hypothetical protein